MKIAESMSQKLNLKETQVIYEYETAFITKSPQTPQPLCSTSYTTPYTWPYTPAHALYTPLQSSSDHAQPGAYAPNPGHQRHAQTSHKSTTQGAEYAA